MKRLRFIFLYIKALVLRYNKQLLLGLVGLALLTFIGLRVVKSLVRESFSEGIVGNYTESNLPPTVTSLLTQGLVGIGPDESPVPGLAKSWSSSDDSTSYTFTLKDNLSFTDGTKLDASSIRVELPPDSENNISVKVAGDKTLEFKLTDSYSPFPSFLASPVFKKGTNIGTGPYQISQTIKASGFVKRLTLTPTKSTLPTVIIHFYPTENLAKTALKVGEVQSILGINDLSDLVLTPPFALLGKTNLRKLVTIFYNVQDPVLSDENFRLALSYSAPSIKGETEAKTSIQPNSWAFNPSVKDFLDNPEAAKSSLDKVKNGRDSTIVLTATNTLQGVGQQIINSWQAQGIKAVMRVESGIPQNFQSLLISQDITPDPDQYSLWHKLGPANISKYSNARTDKDLEDGRKLKDIDQRKQKYQDFQKILLDHAPAAFLYFPKYNVVYLKKIESKLKAVVDLQLQNII